MASKEEAEAGVKAGTLIKRGGVYVEAAVYNKELPGFKPKKEKAKKKVEEVVDEQPDDEEEPAKKEKKPETYETKVMTPSSSKKK